MSFRPIVVPLVVVAVLVAVVVDLITVIGGCTVVDTPFGARCSDDVDCGANLVCVVDVCVPGGADAGPDLPDGGPDPLVDAGPDPIPDAGPDPVDAGPEPVVFNRAPRAFATTVVVAAAGTATVTLEGSDPDGDTLTFGVAGNGTTASITADGATATVTALDVDGSFTFTVSDGSLSDTATVVVKIASAATDAFTTVFIGDNGESWNDPTNWSNGVPGQVVLGARVPADKVVVVQSAVFNLNSLEVENGAVVELGGFFINTVEARVGGTIRCTSSPCIRATRVAGRLPSWQSNDGGRMLGPTIVIGRLSTAFDFVIDTHPLTTLGPVAAEGGFVQTGSLLHTEGGVALQRNVTLAGGTWSARGNVIRLDGTFFSTGIHRVVLDGPAAQNVTLDGGGGCLNDVDVFTPDLVLGANAAVCGRFTVRAGGHVGGDAVLELTGPFVLEVGGRIDVAELRPRGSLELLGDGFDVPVVRLVGNLTAPDLPYRDLVVAGNGTTTLVGDIAVTGALRSILNDFAEVDVGEFTLSVGTLALLAPARLNMIFPDARVVIAGDAVLAPNNGSTMSNGVVEVGGNLRFDSGVNARFGDGQHTWRITGTSTFSSANATALVGRLEVAEGAALTIGDGTPLVFEPSTALVINGPLTIPVGTTLRLLTGTTVTCGPAGTVTLNGLCTRSDVPCATVCP